MSKNEILDEYFEWLINVIQDDDHFKNISYRKLLTALHNRDFIYTIDRDKNRAVDGIYLRYRFCDKREDTEYIMYNYLDGPCSVLEMMIGLALRCEEAIMLNPYSGDQTPRWFWEMVESLGLIDSYDENFDKRMVNNVINDFLNRNYEPNGRGGLFTVNNKSCDLTKVEIWYQMCWHLDTLM